MRYFHPMFLLALLLGVWGCDRPDRPPPADTVPEVEEPDIGAAADDMDEDFGDTDIWHFDDDDTLTTLPPQRAQMAASTAMEGLPVGPTLYDGDRWCSGNSYVPATIGAGMPDRIAPVLKKANDCNMRIALTLPRSLFTSNGLNHGPYNAVRARRAMDVVAAKLAQVPSAHRDNLLYYSVLDDMGCEACWGGTKVTHEQTAAHTRYARSKFPSWVAVGLRVDPAWMAQSRITDWRVDVTTVQWHTRKGPKNLSGVPKQKAWYEASRLVAPKLGIKRMIYAVNIHDCDGAPHATDGRPCSPQEIRDYGAAAINFDPATNCGFLSWRYDGVYFHRDDYERAWREIIELGRSKPKLLCKA